MLTAVLPPLVLALGEKLIFGTGYIGTYLLWRLTPLSIHTAMNELPELLLGLPVAAALLYLAIRLRRYRDDT